MSAILGEPWLQRSRGADGCDVGCYCHWLNPTRKSCGYLLNVIGYDSESHWIYLYFLGRGGHGHFFSGKLPHCRNMGWISKEPRLSNVEGTVPIHFHGASTHTGVLPCAISQLLRLSSSSVWYLVLWWAWVGPGERYLQSVTFHQSTWGRIGVGDPHSGGLG